MRRLFLATPSLLLLLALTPADRSGVVLTGRVTDAATGRALPGAQVTTAGGRHGAVTDANGGYRLEIPSAGVLGSTLTLRAALIGYQVQERRVEVDSESVRVDFALSAAAVALEELVVTAAGRDSRSRKQVPLSVAQVAASPAPLFTPSPEPYRRRGAPWNTESYDHIAENPFLAATSNPLSTFSIDVDRASYSNVRRFIEQGQRPPVDAVRIEELVNYFSYELPEPRGEHPFSVTTEVGPAPWRPEHRLVRIGLQARRVDTRDLPPNNLVFLIDVSGSMQPANKLPLLKQSLRMLVDELRSQDRVAMVVYAGSAGLVLPPTSGSEKERILRALDALEAGGSTAGGEGIRLAYAIARKHHMPEGNNRVILCTDGDFNVGVSSDAEMVRLIEEKRRQGTYLTVLGFGMGNLKDSKMEKLADHGNGNYAYIDGLLEARKVLVSEMGGTLLTLAKDVKLQVEFNPARVRAYRLIGYENRVLAAEDFDDDAKDAGELGAGHSVTALYEVVPVGVRSGVEVREVGSLRYQQPTRPSGAARGAELAFVKLRYKRPDSETSRLLSHPIVDRQDDPSTDFTFAAAVAGFGMLLRDSEHRGSATLEQVLELARRGRGRDREGYRADFVRLVERARALDLGPVPTQEEAG